MKLNLGFMAKVFAQQEYTFQPPADPNAGRWEGGRWIPADPPEAITATATVLPMTAYDLQYYAGGTYTTEDVKVIAPGHVQLPLQSRFEHNGAMFEIREARDYEEVADLRRYVAKRLRDGDVS